MRQFKLKQGMPYLILGVLSVAACWFFVGRYGVFGTTVDWLSQHSVFPDYFRQQFYETKELFPEFAANIGGGQNIYNFSYYGLYNPVILVSYLLPFVKMSDYLMAAGVVCLMAAVWIFYFWLGKRGFSQTICLVSSVLLLLAGPMIFHSYHQIMFVNYMPFLCLAFVGLDRHFEKKRSGLFVISVCLMILTSFYFSICGMLVLFLYGVSRCVELRKGYGFVCHMILAVCMSGVLLVPTAAAILGNRRGGQEKDMLSLLIPDLSVTRLTYSSYGIGLTTLVITALIAGLTYRKMQGRVLICGCVIVLMIPVFGWVLNGGLYVRDKAFIPFLPLLCYLIAVYLKKQERREISFRVNLISYAITLGMICYGFRRGGELSGESFWGKLILAEGILLFFFFLLFWRYRSIFLLVVPSICCLFVYNLGLHRTSGEIIDREFYRQVTDTRIGETIAHVLEQEQGFYRLEQGGTDDEKSANLNRIWNMRQGISSIYSSAYNEDYQAFRRYIFGLEEPFRNDMMQAVSENPLFQKLMGVKYVLAEGEQINGQSEGREVRENQDVAPVIYVTDQLIPESDYDGLEFPYNQTALMKYAVVRNKMDLDDQWRHRVEETAELVEMEIPEKGNEDAVVERLTDDSYHIETKRQIPLTCRIEENGADAGAGQTEARLLYIQFEVKNRTPNRDVTISVDEIRDKLTSKKHFYYNKNTTFTYVTTLEEGEDQVEVVFGAGDYDITELKCFLGSKRVLAEEERAEDKLYQSEFQVDWEQTKGNQISGKVFVKHTGYLITSIPYDMGFEIFVDGKRAAAERVNKAFLGFAIGEGDRQVTILYHAPGVMAGKDLSILGILILAAVLCRQQFCKKKNDRFLTDKAGFAILKIVK